MKTLKILVLTLATAGACLTLSADDGKPIGREQLPAASQTFITSYFPGTDISFAKVERDFLSKSYEVFFVDGSKVEFDGDGEWESVDCKKQPVPSGIVPAQIARYVQERHPGQPIVQIDRDTRDYEVELANGIELKFDRRFQIIGYDD